MRRIVFKDGSETDVRDFDAKTVISCEQHYKAPYGENFQYFERLLWMCWHTLRADGEVTVEFVPWVATFSHFGKTEEAVEEEEADPFEQ